VSVDTLLDARWRMFFDWASISPLSNPAQVARRSHLERADRAVDPPLFLRSETARLDRLRESLRRFLTPPGDHAIVLGRSAAELLSLLAAGLPTTADRRVVLLVEPNHPVAALAWAGASRTRPIRVHTVAHDGRHLADLDALAAALDRRCLAVCVTHVTHLHGGVQPIRRITDLAHAAGALCIVDGAQATGRIPVDVAALGCDVYIGAGRKAMLAPIGTAFLSGAAEVLSMVEPSVWSTRSATLIGPDHAASVVAARPGELPARLEGNLPDLAALNALAGSTDALLDIGVDWVQAQVRRLLPYLLDGMKRNGLELQSTAGTGEVANAGIVTFAAPPTASGLDLQARCGAAGFVVAADLDTVRVSLHARNDETAIDALCREMR
jgi:cysteine desulfurase/selenocysteine lyase